MKGRKSRSICVKFREDDSAQMAAWEYLQAECGSRTYAECIAALVENRDDRDKDAACEGGERASEMLVEIRQICMEIRGELDGYIVSSAGKAGEGSARAGIEEMVHPAEIPEGIASLMRQLGGEDEEE